MAGMSEKEIESRKRELYAQMGERVGKPGDSDIVYFWEQTPEEIREMQELDCRSMINSCLIYGSARYEFFDGQNLVGYGLKYRKWLDCDKCTDEQCAAYALPDARVIELFREQKERFAHASVHHNVFTDHEGCTYNSVEWDVA